MGERIGRAIQRLRTEGMWLFSRSVAVLPYWFQYYVLEEIIRVVLRYVIRYRRRLIIRQLSDSFPEKSGREIVKICNDYYGTLAEMVVNTLTLAGMGDAERARPRNVPRRGGYEGDGRGTQCRRADLASRILGVRFVRVAVDDRPSSGRGVPQHKERGDGRFLYASAPAPIRSNRCRANFSCASTCRTATASTVAICS